MYYSNKKILPTAVISIQSQVVYGSVGNNAAVPCLQRYGLGVAVVPTVLFSNTPHYPSLYGGIIPADWFGGFLRGLEERQVLAGARAVILGYLGDSAQAELLIPWLRSLRANRPEIHIGIDPVLGDSDSGLYVKAELAEDYRSGLIGCADLITPNLFELEYLSGQKATTAEAVVASARLLLERHGDLRTVVVTSAPVAAGQVGNLIVSRDEVQLTRHPRVDCDVKGTGDCFQATLTAELLRGTPMNEAVQIAGDFVGAALAYTKARNVGELLLPL